MNTAAQGKWDSQKTVSTNKASRKEFAGAMATAMKNGAPEKMWRVTKQTEESLAEDHPNANLRATAHGSTFAVDNGDIIGVASSPSAEARANGETGKAMMKAAVENGGMMLDSYSGNHAFYTKCGFEPVSWCKFDEQYAPPGWKKNRDDPEAVIFYKYTGRCTAEKSPNKFLSTVAPSADYDEAMSARNALLGEES